MPVNTNVFLNSVCEDTAQAISRPVQDRQAPALLWELRSTAEPSHAGMHACRHDGVDVPCSGACRLCLVCCYTQLQGWLWYIM